MEKDFRQSVFLITSTDPKTNDFGTGFVIHRDGSGTYVLTCRHVVDDVGGKDLAQVADQPVREAILPPEGAPDDLAVLIVDGLKSAPTLSMAPLAETELDVTAYGFSNLDAGRKKLHARRVLGKLGDPGEIAARGQRNRIDTWDLLIAGAHHLQPGYSGSPVIETRSGRVVCVVSHEMDGGQQGLGIDIGALIGIWPEIPEGLLDAPDGPMHGIRDRTRTTFGPIRERMCDRRREDVAFWEQFKRFQRDFPRHPQFFILPGEVEDAHDSFIRRIRDVRLKQTCKTGKPYLVSCTWEDIEGNDQFLLQCILKDGLFEAFACRAGDGDYELDRLCQSLNLKEHPMVIVSHDLQAERWNRHFPRLIAWYVREYWSKLAHREDVPLFLVFFNIIYPTASELNPLERLYWRLFRRLAIRRSLARLHGEMNGHCPCHLFDDLRPIERGQVAAWFGRYLANLSPDDRIDRINAIFKDERDRRMKKLPMTKIEKALKKIIGQLEDGLSGLHN